MESIKLLKIFVASPGDVQRERQLVREVANELNNGICREKWVRFEVYGWETDAFPSFGGDGQAIINSQIGDMSQYHLFIGIMWNRFGNPTPREGSGTEEEFNRAVESFKSNGRPDIMFYFNQQPSNLTKRDELEQKMRVLNFKERVQSDGLSANYDSPEDFATAFRNHLTRWLISRTMQIPEPPANKAESKDISPFIEEKGTSDVTSSSDMWVLLKSSFYLSDEVQEKANGIIQMTIRPHSSQNEVSLREIQLLSGRSELIGYAYQDFAGLARIESADRNSSSTGSVWTVSLKIEPVRAGFMSELAFGNISADDIAVMRARLILLNELPKLQQGSRDATLDTANSTMLHVITSGINTAVKATKSLLPEIWKQYHGSPQSFLPVARLWLVFHLISSNTCEHILELSVGPIQGSRLHIKFKGQRPRKYSNVEPRIIEVEGICDLASPSA